MPEPVKCHTTPGAGGTLYYNSSRYPAADENGVAFRSDMNS